MLVLRSDIILKLCLLYASFQNRMEEAAVVIDTGLKVAEAAVEIGDCNCDCGCCIM